MIVARLRIWLFLFSFLALNPALASRAASTAFTYQGRLAEDSAPASGHYDFKFQLMTAPVAGNAVGLPVLVKDKPVTNGVFTVEIDFGANVFSGPDFWLEVGVRRGDVAGGFTVLNPRQPITAVPYALYAPVAGAATTANNVAWTSLTGIPPGFADGVDNDTTYTAGAGLRLTGTTFSIGPAGVLQSMLALDSVATANLQNGAVTDPKLADAAITRGKIASGQVVKSLNNLHDDIAVMAGNNIAVNTAAGAIQVSAIDVWRTAGNSGTTSANFLGTIDTQPFELRVNNARAWRVEPGLESPNLIGGVAMNAAAPGVFGAVIGGGGDSNNPNLVTDPYGTVGGGYANQAGNGDGNFFIGQFATVSGGSYNSASGEGATIGGGHRSTASGELATIGGGGYNLASGYAAVIAGGGGYSASLDRSTPNVAMGFWSAIGGGADNTATNNFGVIGGGGNNKAGGIFATIGGGKDNLTTADFATVPGGRLNSARGANSFAAGTRAVAADDGAFVWADGSADFDFTSTAAHEFAVRAAGGVRFVSATGGNGKPTAGVQLPSGGGAWSTLSDRASKTNFAPVAPRAILERVASLPIQTWNYKTQAPSVRHIGIMAQDFSAAFGVGEDERHISTVDADGVALAAIQGLYELVREKEAEMRLKDAELAALKARLEALEKLVSALPEAKR